MVARYGSSKTSGSARRKADAAEKDRHIAELENRIAILENKLRLKQEPGEKQIPGTSEVAHDITGRKPAEDALKVSEARFRALFENAGTAIFVADVADGTILDCNGHAEELIGRPREEIIGMHHTQLYQPSLTEVHSGMFASYARGETTSNYETVVRHRDGRLIPVMINATTLVIDGQEIMMGIFFDISNRKKVENEMSSSREMLRLVMDNIPQRVFWKDIHSDYLGCNVNFARAAGVRDPENIVGKTDFDLAWTRSESESFRRDDREVMDNDRPKYHIIEPQLQADGTQSWLDTNKVPMHDAEGRVIGILGTYEDITERKKAEDSLKLTSFSLDHARDIVFWFYPDGRFYYANDAACKRYGYTKDELLSLTIFDVDSHYTRESWNARWQKLRAEGSLYYETEERTKGGILFPVEVTINYTKYGDMELACAYARDITERKQAEKALRLSEFTMSNLSAEIFWVESNGHIFNVNEAACAALGYMPEELCSMYVWDIAPDYPKERWPSHWRELQERRTFTFESIQLKKDGSRFPTEVMVNYIEFEGREYNCAVVTDITERKRAEAALITAKTDAELYLDLMGHDISNMHQIILGNLEIAQSIMETDGRLERGNKELIDTSIATLHRSAKLIKNIRDIQNLRQDEFKLQMTDLGELLDRAVKEYSGLPGRDVSISYEPVHGCYVMANALLYDVINNLIDNAVKHCDDPVRIGVSVASARLAGRRYYRMAVEDNGRGIPDNVKSMIFSRLKQGETRGRGTGLGLYIVKMLVEGFDGKVSVEDRVPGDPSRGVRFVVMLPSADS